MSYVASVRYTDNRGKGIRYGYGDTPEKALSNLKDEMVVWKLTPDGKPHVVKESDR